MPRIEQATIQAYTAPLVNPYETATARHNERRGLILTLHTTDSIQGLGEATPFSNRTESLTRAQDALITAASRLEQDRLTLQEALETLDELLPDPDGTPTARFALETALQDANARHQGTPLAGHLATHEHPPEAIPVNATIPATTPEETGEQASNATDQGFTTIKLKATGDWEMDQARIHHAREHAPDANLRLDVNGAWPDHDAALERLEALEPYQLEYVEQPLPPDAIEQAARLKQASPTPLAADEPLTSLDAIRCVLDADAADLLVIKPMVLGGLQRTQQAHRIAKRHDTPLVITSTIDGAIARAGALHTAAALGPRDHACGLATGHLFEHEPAAYDERIQDGSLMVPKAPGHSAWITQTLEAI